MRALTVLMFVAAFLSALVVNAEVRRRSLANGDSFGRSAIKSGAMACLAAAAIIAAYLGIGWMVLRLID